MAEFDQEAYRPEEGDLYIIEVRTGHFVFYRYNGLVGWTHVAPLSEKDVQTLTAPMQFIGESKGHRRYYRPSGDLKAIEAQSQADLEAIQTDEQAIAFISRYMSRDLRLRYIEIYRSDRHVMNRSPRQAIDNLLSLPPLE